MSSMSRPSCSLCSSVTRKSCPPYSGALFTRFASTSASTSSSVTKTNPSTSNAPSSESKSSKTRVVAGILLSRAPLQSNPLTDFEREYYKYARKINRAIGAPFDPEWFFRKGSQGYEGWKELVAIAEENKELTDSIPSDANQIKQDQDQRSLARLPSRTLYLLAKKNRKNHAWQFPQGGVEETGINGSSKKEDLVQAAKRELLEEFGTDLDVWMTGRVPAAWLAYDLPKGEERDGCDNTKVFFMPARILRGTPQANKADGLEDYAWCTREEICEKVGGGDSDLWKAVEPALSY